MHCGNTTRRATSLLWAASGAASWVTGCGSPLQSSGTDAAAQTSNSNREEAGSETRSTGGSDATPIPDASLLAADGSTTRTDGGTGPSVYSGGTTSVNNVFGMYDLAIASNTVQYRSMGGKLYVHEVGWESTSESDRQAIRALFPEAPIYETGLAQALGALESLIKPYWPDGAYVACVNGAPSVADMQSLKTSSLPLTKYIGIYVSPNDGTTYKTRFEDPSFDNVRTEATIGGALCIDAPPQFYFANPDAYRQWTADEVAWATSHGVVVVFSLFPMSSADEWSDAQELVFDVAARGAVPSIWAVNGYYDSAHDAMHPIGSEKDTADSMYTALHLLEHPGPAIFTKSGNNGMIPCSAFCSGSGYAGGTGSCVGGWLSATDQSLDCSTAAGAFDAGTLTCSCDSNPSPPPLPSAPPSHSANFVKNGNNGSVSCDTYCAGSQWPGGTGTCISAVTATHQSISCSDTASGGLTCTCYGIIPTPPSFVKGGDDGTISCNAFCAGPEWDGGTGSCSGAVLAATGPSENCSSVDAGALTCSCYTITP